MAMVFTLVSTLKDSAELLISERANAAQALVEVEAQKAEEAENAKFHGEKVTRERFLEWRERFRREAEERELKEKEEKEAAESKGRKGTGGQEKKMTGRELWEKGIAGRGDEEEEDGAEDVAVGVEKMKVAA